MPVLCKVSVPAHSCKTKHVHRDYELKFQFKDLSLEENNRTHNVNRNSAIGHSGTGQDATDPKMENSIFKDATSENVLNDLVVYVSTYFKEPNEGRCDLKVSNKSSFMFKFESSAQSFVYFTLTSEKGRRLRV